MRASAQAQWLAALLALGLPLGLYLGVAAKGYDGKPFLRGDCPYYFAAGLSLLEDRDLDLGNQLPGDPLAHSGQVALDVRGRVVPKHPLPLALVALPAIAAFGPGGALAFNLLQLGLLLLLLYRLALDLSSPAVAALAVAATGTVSFLPHFAWNFSPDVFSTLLLVTGLWALAPRAEALNVRRVFWGGLALGTAVVSKFALLVTLPGLWFLLPRPIRQRANAALAAGLALPWAAFAAFNWRFFGAPWVTSYDRIARAVDGQWVATSQRSDFDLPFVLGATGQLFDPAHGLWSTSLITLFSLAGLGLLAKKNPGLCRFVGLATLGLFVFFAFYRPWSTSHYGNRFLIPVVALAVLPLAVMLDHARAWLRRLSTAKGWRWRPSREQLAFLLLLLLHLAPIWSVPHFPSQDGATHLANASIALHEHRADRPALRHFYRPNETFTPTWGGHLAQVALLLWLPPLAAEKLFLSGSVLLLLLSARWFLAGLSPGARPFVYLVFPFSASYLFHMGFLPFCYSVGGLLLLLGVWWRHRGEVSWRHGRRLAWGFFALWLGHPVTLVVALATLGLAGWALAWNSAEPGRQESMRSRLWRLALFPCLAGLPAVWLLLRFATSQEEGGWAYLPKLELARALVTLDSLVSYQRFELWATVPLAVALLSSAGWWVFRLVRERRLVATDALLPAALGCLALYFFAPNSLAGGGWVSHRLNLLFFLLLLSWLATQPWPAKARQAAVSLGVAASLLLLGLHWTTYRRIEPYLEEYLELASQVPAGSTLLPLTSTPWGFERQGRPLSVKVRPFLNAAAYVGPEGDDAVVLLNNYQAGKGYFPVVYRAEVDPFRHLAPGGGFRAVPPRVDLAAYSRTTRVPVHFVLTWGFDQTPPADPGTQAILAQLRNGYEPVATSAPSGLGKLYRWRGVPSPPRVP